MPGELRLAVSHPLITWAPRPLPRPQVDPDLTALPAVVRAAEVLRYSAAKFEYWISPGGHIRETLRLSSVLAALLAPPALLVAPLVTLLLTQVSDWLDLLVKIALNVAGLAVAFLIGRTLLRMMKSR